MRGYHLQDGHSRAQSAVIGFVLMFGLVMLLMTILQMSAVPAWNQGEEFAHSQQVRGELELLRDDISETAIRGSVTSESITLGLRYPRRPFLLNPTDPTGRIETTEQGSVRLENLTASGETGDYWTGESRTFTTRHVVYTPDYNEYDNGPSTVLENSVLYDRYDDRVFPLTTETVVSNRRITLVTLNGSLSRTSVTSEDIELQPVSAPQQVTSVEGDGPVRLHLPTRLPETRWEALLEDEFVANGGNVYDNVSVVEGDPYDTVTITLRGDQTYTLRLAEVGVGSRLARLGPHYVTTDSPTELRVPTGSTDRVVLEVRDRYNNPVSGVRVNATVDSGPGTVEAIDATTDKNGHAAFRYTATDAGTATVNATFGVNPGELETATVAVEAVTTGSEGGTDGPVVTDVDTNQTTTSGQSVPQETVLTLNATASDFQRGGTDIYAVEWWSNRTEPGGSASSGFALSPVGGDGEFDSVEERVTAPNLDTGDWDTGWHALSVRARDADGHWGPVTNYSLEITNAGAATSTSYVSGTATTNNADNRFRFDINTSGKDLTLSNASIDTTQLGGVRDGLRDIDIGGNGVRLNGGAYASDDTPEPLTDPVVTGPTTVKFGNFDNGNGNAKLPGGSYTVQETEPAGDHLSVTLGFADGTTKTLYFVPP